MAGSISPSSAASDLFGGDSTTERTRTGNGPLVKRGFGRSLPPHRRSIAVGTAVAGGPPRRSQRALLTHWAPALGAGVESRVRPGMHRSGWWEPSGGEAVHALPAQAGALAAAP